MVLMIGLMCSANLGINRDKDVRRPTSRCTSFKFWGLLISNTALHLSELASIPRAVSMKPKNLPADTPKVHLAGFKCIPYLRT